jgi:membrane protease YdiL (CAAX protease family)
LHSKSNRQILLNILLFAAGVFAFAYFIHHPGWQVIIALAGLAIPCVAVYRHTLTANRPQDSFHQPNNRYFFITLIAGLSIGAGVGIYYRINIGASPIPLSLTWFAPVAVIIGLAEEFVFRGVAFYLVKKWPVYITIPLTAFLHAFYKTILFLPPNLPHSIDTWFLFYTTFLAGLVIGFLRHAGGSVIPAMASHGLWDAIVYGDSPAAPWWVW